MPRAFSAARSLQVGIALGDIEPAVYEAIDRGEPEWPVLCDIARLTPPYDVLTALALGLTDFQLGSGGAKHYWRDVRAELDRVGPIDSLSALRELMSRVISRPSAARLNKLKNNRMDRLVESTLADWIGNRSIGDVGHDSMQLWRRLAGTMNQAMNAKTIVFAIKVADLLHRIETGSYMEFPARVPIVVDLRIARVTFTSGLLPVSSNDELERTLAGIEASLETEREVYLSAWAAVAENAGDLSLLRIDSLVWQLAEPIFKLRNSVTAATNAAASTLRGYGAREDAAMRLAIELTYALS